MNVRKPDHTLAPPSDRRPPPVPAAWRSDLRRLWAAYSVSELGSAVGAGALPLIAVLVLDVSAWQVSMLAVAAGIASAAVAVPLAPWIEVHANVLS